MTIEMVGKVDVVPGHAKTYAKGTETEPGSEIMDESSETEKVGEIQEALRTRRGHQGTMHTAMERRCLHIGFRCHTVCMAGLRSQPCTMADTCSGRAEDLQGRQQCFLCLTR